MEREVRRVVRAILNGQVPFPPELRPPEPTGLPSAWEIVKLLERMGYRVEQEWEQGHGNGGSITMQLDSSNPYSECNTTYNTIPHTFVVNHSHFGGRRVSLREEGSPRNYRGARRFLEELAADSSFAVQIGGFNIDETAGGERYYDGDRNIYTITGVAGHGMWINMTEYDSNDDALGAMTPEERLIAEEWAEIHGY